MIYLLTPVIVNCGFMEFLIKFNQSREQIHFHHYSIAFHDDSKIIAIITSLHHYPFRLYHFTTPTGI